jgi:hypothetical protein
MSDKTLFDRSEQKPYHDASRHVDDPISSNRAPKRLFFLNFTNVYDVDVGFVCFLSTREFLQVPRKIWCSWKRYHG